MRPRVPPAAIPAAALLLLAAPATVPAAAQTGTPGAWAAAPPLLHARSAHAVVSDGRALWVLGGTGEGHRPVLEVERFDGTRWEVVARLPGDGLNAPAAALVDGRIFLVGGFNTTTNVPSAAVLVLDTRSLAWSEAAPMPAPRGGHGVAVLDGRIHVVGGGNDQRTLADHLVYDPGSDAWQAAAPLPRAKGSPGVVALEDRLWVIGGRSGYDDFGEVDVWDPATDTWRSGPPIGPRGTHGAVVFRDAIHVVGGESQKAGAVLGEVLRLDPGTGTWEALPPLPTPRNYGRAAVLGEALFVVGGNTGVGNSHAAAGSRVVERYVPGAGG